MTENIHDWVGAYALDSLTADEAAQFEAHLAECADCREELSSFDVVLEALADEGPGDHALSFEASSALHARISAQVAETPQDAAPLPSVAPADVPSLAAVPDVADDAPATDAAPVTEKSNVVSFETHARRKRGPVAWLAAAAAAGVVVAGVGIGLNTLGTDDPTEVAYAAISEADDVQRLDLGVGDAVLLTSDEAGGFAVSGTAPELAEGEQYQLWMVNADGTVDPGPTFDAGDVSTGLVVPLDGVAAIAVSVEPAGGSEQPTTDPISAVTL